MEPKGKLPCQKQPVTKPYLEPDEFSPRLHNLFCRINFNITLPSASNSTSLSLTFRFSG